MATLEDLERRIEVLERDTATDYLESAAMTARLMGWQQRAEAAERCIGRALSVLPYASPADEYRRGYNAAVQDIRAMLDWNGQ